MPRHVQTFQHDPVRLDRIAMLQNDIGNESAVGAFLEAKAFLCDEGGMRAKGMDRRTRPFLHRARRRRMVGMAMGHEDVGDLEAL